MYLYNIIYLGNFGGNGAEGRRNTHVFSAADHGETSATASGQDMVDTRGVSSAVSRGNAVKYVLHMDTEGNRGALGRFATNIGSMRRQYGIRRGRARGQQINNCRIP